MARKKRHSKSKKNGHRRIRRNRGHRRLRRNPSDILTLVLLAGGGYLAWRWYQGQHATPSAAALPAATPTVVTPAAPPAVSGLGTLVVV